MDIVVFGATGFVGRLVAEYLAEHAPAGVTIGLAGRSPEKLERTAAELGIDWPLVVADTSDAASLAALFWRSSWSLVRLHAPFSPLSEWSSSGPLAAPTGSSAPLRYLFGWSLARFCSTTIRGTVS